MRCDNVNNFGSVRRLNGEWKQEGIGNDEYDLGFEVKDSP